MSFFPLIWREEIHLKFEILSYAFDFSTRVSLLGNEWVKLINDSFSLIQLSVSSGVTQSSNGQLFHP